MLEIIKLSAIITIGIVGAFLIFGFILRVINSYTNSNLVRVFGTKAIITTGIIGTSLHELSHYMFAKIFLHRVNSVKLFSVKIDSNTLGYVNHSYNKRSLYQRAGNFFIGIAPILVGTSVIILLFRVLLPARWDIFISSIDTNNYIALGQNFNIHTVVGVLFNEARVLISSIFNIANLKSIEFWIFLFLVISISTHMSLSMADFKGAFTGIAFIYIVVLVLTILAVLLGIEGNTLIVGVIVYNILIVGFMFIGLIFSLIALGFSIIISMLKR